MNILVIIILGLIGVLFGKIEANNKDLSYHVRFYKTLKNGTYYTYEGVLIHQKLVLTTAFAVQNAAFVSVFNGNKPQYNSPYLIVVQTDNILSHTGFNPETWENDIAMISLPNEGIVLQNYIRLATNCDNCLNPSSWVSEWRYDSNNIEGLYFDYVRPMSSDICKLYWGNIVHGKQFCSSTFDPNSKTCPGGIGSGYVFENKVDRYLCGLNSYSVAGCNINYPSVKTSVAHYVENGWICRASGGLISCLN